MPPRLLEPVLLPLELDCTTVLAVPIGGNGAFPLGIAKTFAQQFTGNKRCSRVISLAELLFAAASEARISVFFLALPEWRLFKDGKYTLDTPETTFNFMLYYVMIIVFPTEDSEIVYKGIVAKLITENSAIINPTQSQNDNEDEDGEAPRKKFTPRTKGPIETPRIKIFRAHIPPDAATQLSITDIHTFKEAVEATGVPTNQHLPDSDTLADELWILLANRLSIDAVLDSLQKIKGLLYPPWISQLNLKGSAIFQMHAEILKFKLIYKVPCSSGKDQLATFMLPGIINPARISQDDNFDVPMIGESLRDTLYVASDTRGSSFKNPLKLVSPLSTVCSEIFGRLLRLAPDPLEWSYTYRYLCKYLTMLFSNPYVAGFPSVYRDLYNEIDRLRAKELTDPIMKAFYAPRRIPANVGVLHHQVQLICVVLFLAGMRENLIPTALGFFNSTGSCRIHGGDSDITAFTGTAGKGKSNILNMISALMNEASQYSMDASSARAITMPSNPIMIGGKMVGEAYQRGRCTFTDDGGGTFNNPSGAKSDDVGAALKLVAATKGVISYQVICPNEDANGTVTNKIQTRMTACKGATFTAMNGNKGSSAGATRMQEYFIGTSKVPAAQTASAVCALDIMCSPPEIESMYAANQLRNALVCFDNALDAFGLKQEGSLCLLQVFIVHALENPAARAFPKERQILEKPRQIGSIVRTSLNLANNKAWHILKTCGFEEAFIGNNKLLTMMWMQQANYVSTEVIALAVSSSLPCCNGIGNVDREIYRQIKELIEFNTLPPHEPRTTRKGGKSYYYLSCPTLALLQQSIRDHLPDYEPVDVANKLAIICKTTVPTKKQQYLDKDGDRLIFYAKALDSVFSALECNVLNIYQTLIASLRAANPLLHDCFPHDTTDEFILIPQDQCYQISKHAGNNDITELGDEFEKGISLLKHNIVAGKGKALATNTTQSVHPRDIAKPAQLSHHFPGTPILVNCTAINIKALSAGDNDLATGFLQFIPCFRDELCMIATCKAGAPTIPETVLLTAHTEPYLVSNPMYLASHLRMIGTTETSVVEKEFFGCSYKQLEIPPGPITELYMLYTRVFVLNRQVPLEISRPDFIQHFLRYNVDPEFPYVPYLPEPFLSAIPLNPQTATIYMLFVDLAQKIKDAGLTDAIIEHLLSNNRKRKHNENE